MRVAVAVAFLVLIAAALPACSKKSDEELIREVIAKAIDAANEKSASKVVEDAAPGFKGPQNADVQECRRILLGWFMQQGWLRVFQRELEVKVDGERATAELDAILAKGNEVKSLEDVVPTNASAVLFSLELAKIDGAWKFTGARYQQQAM